MKKLDLHGIKHIDAGNKVDTFIRQNLNNLPIEIITGNSLPMQQIVKKTASLYHLRATPKSMMNLGSYIVSNQL